MAKTRISGLSTAGPLIGLGIPKRSFQTDVSKNLNHVVGSRPPRIHRQSIFVPGYGQLPKLLQ